MFFFARSFEVALSARCFGVWFGIRCFGVHCSCHVSLGKPYFACIKEAAGSFSCSLVSTQWHRNQLSGQVCLGLTDSQRVKSIGF